MFKKIFLLLILLIISCSSIFDEGDETYYDDEQHPTPSNIRIISVSETSLKIEWPPLWDKYENSLFCIERSDSSENYIVLADSLHSTFFIDTTLNKKLEYKYSIKAFNYKKSSHFIYITVKYDYSNINIMNFEFDRIDKVSFNKKGTYFACNTREWLYVWETENWSLILPISNVGNIFDHAFSHNLDRIAICKNDTISIYNIQDGSHLIDIQSDPTINNFAFSPDDNKIVTRNEMTTEDGAHVSGIRLYDLVDRSLKWKIDNVGGIYGLMFTNDNDFIICCSYGHVKIYRVADGFLHIQFPTIGEINQNPLLSPDGSKFVVITCNILGKKMSFWNSSTWNNELNLNIPESYHNSVLTFAYGFEDNQIFYSNVNSIRLFDINDNSIIYSFSSNIDMINTLATSQNSKLLACGDFSGFISIWSSQLKEQWCLTK